jgi:hypothetical protein
LYIKPYKVDGGWNSKYGMEGIYKELVVAELNVSSRNLNGSPEGSYGIS